MTPSQKRIAAIGLFLILVTLVAKQFLLKSSTPDAFPIPPVHYKNHAPATKAKAKVQIDKTLPAPLRRELAKHKVVVAILYSAGQDQDALAAARQGAAGAHAGFTALDVAKEPIAKAIALKAPGTADPSVLVVTRPGTITVLLPGYADADAVASAVKNAR